MAARKSTGKGSKGSGSTSKTKNVAPKGTVRKMGGKKYISEGKGNWRGVMDKPKQKILKVKPKTKYKSTGSKKGKPTKRRK